MRTLIAAALHAVQANMIIYFVNETIVRLSAVCCIGLNSTSKHSSCVAFAARHTALVNACQAHANDIIQAHVYILHRNSSDFQAVWHDTPGVAADGFTGCYPSEPSIYCCQIRANTKNIFIRIQLGHGSLHYLENKATQAHTRRVSISAGFQACDLVARHQYCTKQLCTQLMLDTY